MRWLQGRDTVEQMLAASHLQRVTPSRQHADRLIAQADRHLASAELVATGDPPGANALTYDAARKALTAVLQNEGLRPTTSGGHLAVIQAVSAQLDPPLGSVLRPFDRMRRQRHDVEYPPVDAPALTAEDVLEDVEKARAIVDVATRVLDEMSVY